MSEMRQVSMTEDGWIAEWTPECTCSPYGDHHERNCGWEPIGKLPSTADLRRWKAETLREAADAFAVIPHPYEGGVTAWLRQRADRIESDYDRRRAEAEDGHLDALMHEEAAR